MKHYLKKISNVSTFGSVAVLAALALTGCGDKPTEETKQSGQSVAEASKAQGQFLVIQETEKDKYKVIEQYPANGPSRAILKEINGTERLLSEEELKKLAEAEAKKVENNTSNLTKEGAAQMHGGGMSLGETILASAAGALIGGYIANKLFNNPNFQANQRMNTPTQMSQPINKPSPTTASPAGSAAPKPQSGYFQQTPAKSPATPSGSPSTPSHTSSPSSSGSKSFGG